MNGVVDVRGEIQLFQLQNSNRWPYIIYLRSKSRKKMSLLPLFLLSARILIYFADAYNNEVNN